MIISRTPFRVSFSGGGSDLRWFYSKYGGAVISMAIDRHVYISGHPMFDSNETLVKYSKIENVDDVRNVAHPIFRAALLKYGISGVDLGVSSDIPAGTGLGSSSAFTVGLCNLLSAYRGQYLAREELARVACEIEIEELKQNIGKQDQYAAALGGINLINFNKNGEVSYEPLPLSESSLEWLNTSLLLVRVGDTRSASEVLDTQTAHRKDNLQIEESLLELAEIARGAYYQLANRIDLLGKIVQKSWELKKISHPNASTPEIDGMISDALNRGAIAGKLLGAGKSGFVLLVVNPEARERLVEFFSDRKTIKVSLDQLGSSIIYSH